jgi:hypothetical protein
MLEKLKAEILCAGLRMSDTCFEVISKQYSYMLNNEYMHGSFLSFKNGSSVNAALSEAYSQNANLELDFKEEKFFIDVNNKYSVEIIPTKAPIWYEYETPSGEKFSKIFQLHGKNTLFCQLYGSCDYHSSNNGCLFCKFPEKHSTITSSSYKDIEFVVNQLSSDIRKYKYHIAISGGTKFVKSSEYSNINNIINSIRQIEYKVPISVEIAPPPNINQLKLLDIKEIDNLIVNIEFVDEEIRKIFCPEKSNISLEHYMDFLSHCVDIVGRYRVSSVLIYGIENPTLTVKQSEKLLKIGVIPIIIPFRPYTRTKLKNFITTNPANYLITATKVKKLISEYSVNSRNLVGCTNCGGCSIELDQVLTGY